MPKHPFSGIIIADNRLLPPGATAAVERQACAGPSHALTELSAVFAALFDEVILVAADPAALLDMGDLIVSDHYAPAGLLSGIHAGLFAARHSHAFVTAWGLPLPQPAVIDMLCGAAAPRCDAVLAAVASGPQALPAVYAKACTISLARQLAQDRADVRGWLRQLKIREVERATHGPATRPENPVSRRRSGVAPQSGRAAREEE